MALKPYLQLVRLPNLFTAAADSLAGWILATGSLADPARWVPLILISVCVYAAGIVLNDVFDYQIDLHERPNRPLPSGRVPYRFAWCLGFGGLVVGLGLALLTGVFGTIAVTIALIATVLAYNGGGKKIVLGPVLMGGCRSLNLLLGFSQVSDLGGPVAWVAAVAFGIFVMGITWISRSEVNKGGFRGIAWGLFWENLGLLGLLTVALQSKRFPDVGTGQPLIPIEGLLILLITALVINAAGRRALVMLEPATTQRAVKNGVLSLVWLDLGLVAAVRGPSASLAIFLLWVPAFVIGKWLYST